MKMQTHFSFRQLTTEGDAAGRSLDFIGMSSLVSMLINTALMREGPLHLPELFFSELLRNQKVENKVLSKALVPQYPPNLNGS